MTFIAKQNQVETTQGFCKMTEWSHLVVSQWQLCSVHRLQASRPMVAKDGSTGSTGHQLEGLLRLRGTAHSLNTGEVVVVFFWSSLKL